MKATTLYRSGVLLAGNEAFGQAVRFLVSGGLVSAMSASIYWILAVHFAFDTLLSNIVSFVCHVSVGFTINRLWTFKEQCGRSERGKTTHRYVVVSLFALTMNLGWTAMLTKVVGLPAWTPIVPMLCLTPVFTFFLNRKWVF